MMLIELLKTRFEQDSNESVDELISHDARSSAKNISFVLYCQDIFFRRMKYTRLYEIMFHSSVYSD